MAHLPPEHYPITGLCVVADADKCPPGYELLYRSHDKKDDCDLWKDSLFKARIKRYLCVTRVFPLDGGRLNNVLADVVINSNGEIPPDGFALIEKTIDSGEKATRKKQICVKMIHRNSTADAISELIILSRSKRPPGGYTLVGEINGLILCFKMNKVPPDTQNIQVSNGGPKVESAFPGVPTPATPQPSDYMNSSSSSPQSSVYHPYTGWATPYSPAQNYSQGQPQHNWVSAPSYPLPSATRRAAERQGTSDRGRNALTRQESVLMPTSPMASVPFQLSPRYRALQNKDATSAVPEIHFRSKVDIDNEYSYPFRLERQAAAAKDEVASL